MVIDNGTSNDESLPLGKGDLLIAEQAGGIIIWGDQVVLRCTKAKHLVFPKGHIELGETPEETAVREIEEECGLTTVPVSVAGSLMFKKGRTMRRVTYYLMRFKGKTQEYDDHYGVDTFPVPIPWAYNLLTFKNSRKLLKGVEPQIERMVATAGG